VKRLGVSEQNSVVERSSLPPRKGNGGEDRRPTIFARDRQSGIDLLNLLRSAQQSRYCRSHAFAQTGTARFYLVHFPFFQAVAKYTPARWTSSFVQSMAVTSLQFAAAIGISALLYRYYDSAP